MTSSIPPGWYDDPATPGQERWWDGARWSESTRPSTASDAPPYADQGTAAGPQDGVPGPPSPAAAPTQSFPPYGGQGSVPPRPPGAPGSLGLPPPPGGGRPGVPMGPGFGPGPMDPGRGGTSGGHRNRRAVLLGALALAVVGGIAAALIVLLGGDDGDPQGKPTGTGTATAAKPEPGTETDGTATDPGTGVTVPRMKDWEQVPDDPETHQYKGKIPCTSSASASPDEEDPCYLAEIDVGKYRSDDFARMVTEVSADVEENSSYRTTQRLKDEPATVDGKPAHLLVAEVEEKAADATGKHRTAVVQFVFVDAPFDMDGRQAYPVVFAAVDDSDLAPPRGVLDVVLNGIKIGTPQPSAS